MSRRREPRTLEDHRRWAERVRALHAATSVLRSEIARAFPLASREVRATEKALRAVEAIRSPMENAMARDLGEAGLSDEGFIYYVPSARERGSA